MGAAKFRVAERDVSMDVPVGYAPRSTLLPPPPSSELPSWGIPPLTPLVDAVGRAFTMEMDWTDRANDDACASGARRVAMAWDEDRPTLPSAAW